MSSDDARQSVQPERRIDSREIFDGVIVRVRVDQVALPNGNLASREVIEHSHAVVVLPIDDAGDALLVRQYRYPISRDLLEAPAGGMDAGESPAQAAQREMQEEIGYRAGRLEYLGQFWSAPGFCTELMHAFIARDLTPSSLPHDEDEIIAMETHSLDSIREMIRDGRIQDAKTIAAFWMARDRMDASC